jgi:diadenosine tetraphosphate (Ap4A) HIT family hydrolase
MDPEDLAPPAETPAPPPFALHHQLQTDTFHLADWRLCRVLLMNDCRFPWLILVPRRPDLREIHDMAPPDRAQLAEEIARASKALDTAFSPDKVNVGALGNLVEQLHIHVVARWKSDSAWPGPVWGKGKAEHYAPAAEGVVAERLAQAWRQGGS